MPRSERTALLCWRGTREDKKVNCSSVANNLTKIIEACKTDSQYFTSPTFSNAAHRAIAHRTTCRGIELPRLLGPAAGNHPTEVIVCLGAIASQCLLKWKISVGKLRHRWHDYRVITLFHLPSAYLRNPNAKKDVWEDMKVVMEKVGRAVRSSVLCNCIVISCIILAAFLRVCIHLRVLCVSVVKIPSVFLNTKQQVLLFCRESFAVSEKMMRFSD